jgi:hypothetical protein
MCICQERIIGMFILMGTQQDMDNWPKKHNYDIFDS